MRWIRLLPLLHAQEFRVLLLEYLHAYHFDSALDDAPTAAVAVAAASAARTKAGRLDAAGPRRRSTKKAREVTAATETIANIVPHPIIAPRGGGGRLRGPMIPADAAALESLGEGLDDVPHTPLEVGVVAAVTEGLVAVPLLPEQIHRRARAHFELGHVPPEEIPP